MNWDHEILKYFKFKLREIKSIDLEKSHGFYLTEGTSMVKYKINFSTPFLTKGEASFICQMFTHSKDYLATNQMDNILNPKNHVEYLTFQCQITDNWIKEDGVLNGRFIVQFKVDETIQHIREEKIDSILNI